MPKKLKKDQALYIISVAAELAGMHPQTLRIYERKGLLDPQRTGGGSRRYSDFDIQQLRRIHDLTSEGVNLEGVKRIIALENEVIALRQNLGEVQRTYRRDLVPFNSDPFSSWAKPPAHG